MDYLEIARDVGAGQDSRGGRKEDGKDGEETVLLSFTERIVGHKVFGK